MGKTTLVRRLEQDVRHTGGYIVAVDCERFGCDSDPHAPLIHTLSTWAKAFDDVSSRLCSLPKQQLRQYTTTVVASIKQQSIFLEPIPTSLDGARSALFVLCSTRILYTPAGECCCSDARFYQQTKNNPLQVDFCQFVYTLAGLGPCVVTLVNMHQPNETMADFMSALLHAEELRHMERPYLFVATYRPNAIRVLYKCIEVLSTQLVRRGMCVTEIMLQPLGKKELLSRLKQNVIVEHEGTTQNLISIAQGNPLYFEEITRTLVTREALYKVNGDG